MAVEPDAGQVAEIAARAGGDGDGPVVMLNLNRYRDRNAYLRYGEVAAAVLERVGGRILWHADADLTVTRNKSRKVSLVNKKIKLINEIYDVIQNRNISNS